MAGTHSQSGSEKIPGNDSCNDLDISEANDIVAPLSPIKSLHRRPSLGTALNQQTQYVSVLTYLLPDESINAPPSFAESQFATILRRQRPRDTALKISNVPTRYPNLTRDFEFAGYSC